ncbi:hypothetical protein FVEG_15646 [Fusarium verticillioides 7600]|uniref:Uncharacterized protein n=1 Tax=Gibberella moniliformis (strain M3125 / FGSC 7600) TaxID=334819 RepID=W7MA21_GIBM7|nr:hypothetical protein FVEG_15646 [Fusarium verticillioides 7600]EWG44400.1 hypothetical protein FVEG_15646 [Fusarium verticillioides 7600]
MWLLMGTHIPRLYQHQAISRAVGSSQDERNRLGRTARENEMRVQSTSSDSIECCTTHHAAVHTSFAKKPRTCLLCFRRKINEMMGPQVGPVQWYNRPRPGSV